MPAVSSSPDATSRAIASFRIDRSSPVPLYFQVSQHLEKLITDGTIPNGSVLANEIQLAEQLGLSRPTMRRSMQHLVDQGLIVRRRGIGTRVVQPKVRRRLELSSLYDDLVGGGATPATRVLEVASVTLDQDTAARLDCPVGAPAQRVVRLRSSRGVPIAKMTNYLPERTGTFTADELEHHGLYELMRDRGITLHSAVQTVGARTATAAEARLLEEPRGSALLTMQRVSSDDHGVVVEYGTHLYAASRYSFETYLLT